MLYILLCANVLKHVLLCRVKDRFCKLLLRCTLKSDILVSLKKVFYSVLTLNMELLLFHFTELLRARPSSVQLLRRHRAIIWYAFWVAWVNSRGVGLF